MMKTYLIATFVLVMLDFFVLPALADGGREDDLEWTQAQPAAPPEPMLQPIDIASMDCAELEAAYEANVVRMVDTLPEIDDALGAKRAASVVGILVPGAGMMGAALDRPWSVWRALQIRHARLTLALLRRCPRGLSRGVAW